MTDNTTTATRKILDDTDRLDIMKSIEEGITQKKLATGYGVSVGVIHRLSVGRADDLLFQMHKDIKRLRLENQLLKIELYESTKK